MFLVCCNASICKCTTIPCLVACCLLGKNYIDDILVNTSTIVFFCLQIVTALLWQYKLFVSTLNDEHKIKYIFKISFCSQGSGGSALRPEIFTLCTIHNWQDARNGTRIDATAARCATNELHIYIFSVGSFLSLFLIQLARD